MPINQTKKNHRLQIRQKKTKQLIECDFMGQNKKKWLKYESNYEVQKKLYFFTRKKKHYARISTTNCSEVTKPVHWSDSVKNGLICMWSTGLVNI